MSKNPIQENIPVDRPAGSIPPSEAVELPALVEYSEGAVVSRTLAKGPAGTLTVFAFDRGQGLSEHSAPFDAYVTALEGNIRLTIGGESVLAEEGRTVLMPADIPHAVHAEERFKMLLIMLKDKPA